MTDQHPITPPPELVEKWHDDWLKAKVKHVNFDEYISNKAARWGADQELEACITEVSWFGSRGLAEKIRAARRPKPQSLKEQALAWCNDYIDPDGVIRRALEALPDAD